MIKWCLGIWNEPDTQYISLDTKTGKYFFSPFLEEAVLFDSIMSGNPLGTVWLPVFVVNDLLDD